MHNKAVVRAIEDGETLSEDRLHGDGFLFKKNDNGTLTWKLAGGGRFLEHFVIWDRDPSKELRRVLFLQLEIVGVEQNGQRITLP
ncbi:MAG TPA: hypothetical protein VFB79_09255 [Candidatus Angelobacter sp.]|nr:hypothetical protein [Candidatus Angelobacter sp.]